MKAAVARLGASEARQVLQQLEGTFGDRVKGICGLAVELVSPFADSETGPEAVLTSRLTRIGTVVSTLIDQIKEHLALPLSAHSDASQIDSADQLTPLELAALAHIGVDDRYL